MTDREPVDVTNLDRYGDPTLPWERAHALLSAPSKGPALTHFLGTVRPDGRPHAAGIGAVWHDGDFYLTSNPRTVKSRNLAENPACTISVRLEGLDVVLEGEATREVDPGTLDTLAQIFRDGGWPAEVDGDAFTAPFSAPSAGPPPWHLYRFTFHTAIAVATAEPYGATRWRFGA
jgi:Pyridoxamine 5'-phosphate oxidase